MGRRRRICRGWSWTICLRAFRTIGKQGSVCGWRAGLDRIIIRWCCRSKLEMEEIYETTVAVRNNGGSRFWVCGVVAPHAPDGRVAGEIASAAGEVQEPG